MRTLAFLAILLMVSGSALAQVAIPVFTVTSNDVVQSSIKLYWFRGTNQTRVAIKFAYTPAAEKRLQEFWQAYSLGQDVLYQIGNFERMFKLHPRNYFGREGFHGLPESEARAMEDGLRGVVRWL
jgi:hypothetical protein